MRKSCSLLYILLLTSLGACNSTSEPVSSDTFDLAQYQFHTSLLTNGGALSVSEIYYSQLTAAVPLYAPTLNYMNVNGAIQRSDSNGNVFEQTTITSNQIILEGVSYAGVRSSDRFARIGETFRDVELESLTFNETCTLQAHLDSFDLSTATGILSLSSEVYEDVIQVYCVSSFTNADGSTRPNYDWDRYYAKGFGLIFIDGRWPNFLTGDIYAISVF